MNICCKALTTKRKQCKCKPKNGNDFCRFHLTKFECSICLYTKPDDEKITTPCGHCFCKHCLDTWTECNNTCPICRQTIKESLLETYKLHFKEPPDIDVLLHLINCLIPEIENADTFDEHLSQFDFLCKLLNTDVGYAYILSDLHFKDGLLKSINLIRDEVGINTPNIIRSLLIYVD